MGFICKSVDTLYPIIERIKRYNTWSNHDSIICVSGGFDPIHSGHIEYLKSARNLNGNKFRNYLIVIVNGDDFLEVKKGYYFLPVEERMYIIKHFSFVDYVVPFYDGTQNVAGAIRKIRPDCFVNGGDRSDVTTWNPDEVKACNDVGCKMYGGIGGTDKKNSSSDIVNEGLSRKLYSMR